MKSRRNVFWQVGRKRAGNTLKFPVKFKIKNKCLFVYLFSYYCEHCAEVITVTIWGVMYLVTAVVVFWLPLD